MAGLDLFQEMDMLRREIDQVSEVSIETNRSYPGLVLESILVSI